MNRALRSLNPKHLIEHVYGVNAVQFVTVEACHDGYRRPTAP